MRKRYRVECVRHVGATVHDVHEGQDLELGEDGVGPIRNARTRVIVKRFAMVARDANNLELRLLRVAVDAVVSEDHTEEVLPVLIGPEIEQSND